MPHHSTYRRVMGECLDEDEFERVVNEFWEQQPEVEQSVVISIDGKTLRGTITLENPFGLHLLAAYLPNEGIVLMQMEVEKDKENEIVIAPQLLKCLDLRNKVVVGDAMHTQRNLSAQIVEAGGDYVWIVKDNQPKTRQAIEILFAPEKPVPGLGCPPMDLTPLESWQKLAIMYSDAEKFACGRNICVAGPGCLYGVACVACPERGRGIFLRARSLGQGRISACISDGV